MSFRFASARLCTLVGRGAYCRPAPMLWPSVTSHLMRYTTALPLLAALIDVRTMSQLNPAIGYVVSPGSSVMEKLVALTLVFCAAAAVAPSTLACTKLPFLFLR